MAPSPALSIIIPAFNEEKLLAASLRAVKAAASSAFKAADLDWELVVCDNNSTDRTAEIARAEGATVVFEPVNQIGRARNTGASVATGRWLLFGEVLNSPAGSARQGNKPQITQSTQIKAVTFPLPGEL